MSSTWPAVSNARSFSYTRLGVRRIAVADAANCAPCAMGSTLGGRRPNVSAKKSRKLRIVLRAPFACFAFCATKPPKLLVSQGSHRSVLELLGKRGTGRGTNVPPVFLSTVSANDERSVEALSSSLTSIVIGMKVSGPAAPSASPAWYDSVK